MNAYAPHQALTFWGTVGALVAVLLAGHAITRLRSLSMARVTAWVLVLGAVVGVERLNARESAGFRMIAIIGCVLYAMKAVVAVEARALGAAPLSTWRWFGFAALWPGMRPAPFARAGASALPGAGHLLGIAASRLAAGASLIALARLAWVATGSRLLATALVLPGLSLVLHFGVFNLLAGAWRLAGVDCQPLFRAPIQSTSLAEFWGRRWNIAFSEMIALALFQPLVRRAGRRPALAASFLGSGLLHELAISVPVRAGYGLPMTYFALHGVLVAIERRRSRRGWPIDRVVWVGRVWVLGWLLVPLPILFHWPFLAGVVWPLIGIK